MPAISFGIVKQEMKRILSLILCLTVLLSFAACGKNTGDGESTSYREKTKQESLDKTVKIKVPLETIDEKYRDDLDAYCEHFGYESAKLNKSDNTVSIVMNKFSHDLLKTSIAMKVINAMYEVENKDEYPYVDKIESYDTENFSKVVLSVDGSQYKKGASAAFMVAQSCLVYQLYAGDTKYKCEVEVIDKDTKKVIDTQVFTDKDK